MTINGPEILWVIPILGGIPITQTTLTSWVAMVLIIVLSLIFTRKLSLKNPGKLQILAEKLVTMLYNLVESTMGKHNLFFAPYIGTLFLSSIFGSLLSMTGFLRSSTADLSTTLAWALVTTGMVWFYSIKNNGFLGWLKGFTEPIPLLTPINLISEVATPVSMSFRHFGNVVGGTVITTLLYGALATLSAMVLQWIPNTFINSIPIFQAGIPAVLSIYFDLFSGFIQALIFCTLTMVYVGGANPPKEDLK